MTRRAGLTMTEVLAALFIMALGTIAILTLFPLGAMNMASALKDDRTAQAASAADNYMRWYWKTYVVENRADGSLAGTTPNFNNSGFDVGDGAQTPPLPNEPSYAVFVDPIGSYLQTNPTIVAGLATLPRKNLALVSSPTQAIRTCTLLDGLTYDSNGLPQKTGVSDRIERDMRYNWLWVLQRPRASDRNTATMTVVVFDKRGAYPTDETLYTVPSVTPNTTSLQLPATSGVQKGTWLMDATPQDSSATPIRLRHAYFYRIVSVTDAGGGNMNVELETPIKRSDGGSAAYNATIIVLAGVADVFSRPNLTGTP